MSQVTGSVDGEPALGIGNPSTSMARTPLRSRLALRGERWAGPYEAVEWLPFFSLARRSVITDWDNSPILSWKKSNDLCYLVLSPDRSTGHALSDGTLSVSTT